MILYMDNEKSQKINWTSYEYNHGSKNFDFVWTIGILGFILFVLSIVFKNFIFSIFIILSTILLIFFYLKHPDEIDIEINSDGILVGKELYLYKKIKGFKIKKETSKLILNLDRYFFPIHTILIPENLTDEIKKGLSNKIKEEESLDETFFSKFMDKIGF